MWVNKFGNVISAVPPAIIRLFAAARDTAVVRCLEEIQQYGRLSSRHTPYRLEQEVHRCTPWYNMAPEATLTRTTALRDPSLHASS